MATRIAGIVQFRTAELKAIEKAIQYAEANYLKDITAADLAVLFSIPLKKLQEGVKKKIGMSLHEYQATIRIDQAKILLADGNFSKKEIADRTGFTSASLFSSSFKKRTGITPSQYRLSLSN